MPTVITGSRVLRRRSIPSTAGRGGAGGAAPGAGARFGVSCGAARLPFSLGPGFGIPLLSTAAGVGLAGGVGFHGITGTDILARAVSTASPARSVASYRVLIGLEVHVQLATRTKMFTAAPSGAANFGAEPNSLVDEQVLGLPGSLPVMNRAAVEHAIKAGLALGCKIARHTKWDRKSYYYPDLPKNYQISQYDLPLCFDGAVEIGEPASAGGESFRIRIRRAHLEEDAGKLLHEAPGG